MSLLTDGYQTLVTLAGSGTDFYEKEVQPPDLDGGGPIDTTTMRNTTNRTQEPPSLEGPGEMMLQVQYDPDVYALPNFINYNQLIVVTFPDDSTLSFWGWVGKFTPPSHKEKEMPLAEIKIFRSNRNSSGVITPPVYDA